MFLQLTHGQTEAKAEDGLPSVSEMVSDNISIDSLSLDDSDSSTSFSDRISEFIVCLFLLLLLVCLFLLTNCCHLLFVKKKKPLNWYLWQKTMKQKNTDKKQYILQRQDKEN